MEPEVLLYSFDCNILGDIIVTTDLQIFVEIFAGF